MKMKDVYPSAGLVASAPLVELAGHVLRFMAAIHRGGRRSITPRTVVSEVGMEYHDYHHGPDQHAMQAVAEAFWWLSNQGLVSMGSDDDFGLFRLTRLGEDLVDSTQFTKWIEERELPSTMLHATIVATALPYFQQQRFDSCVFEAFKSLEVSIREAAGFGPEHYGTDLAQRAFNVDNGPLTDLDAPLSERKALVNMMMGAIGSYKNPHSHRRVEIGAAEAREMLIMASHLLRIVDARRKPI